MDIQTLSSLMLGSIALLLLLGMPMAFALGFVAISFTLALFGFDALLLIYSRIYGFVNRYALIAVPMLLLMATIMDKLPRIWRLPRQGQQVEDLAHLHQLAHCLMARCGPLIQAYQ